MEVCFKGIAGHGLPTHSLVTTVLDGNKTGQNKDGFKPIFLLTLFLAALISAVSTFQASCSLTSSARVRRWFSFPSRGRALLYRQFCRINCIFVGWGWDPSQGTALSEIVSRAGAGC